MAQGIAGCDLGTKDPAQLRHWSSPYFLLFISEAVLPADVAFRAPRIENYDEENNDQARQDDVD